MPWGLWSNFSIIFLVYQKPSLWNWNWFPGVLANTDNIKRNNLKTDSLNKVFNQKLQLCSKKCLWYFSEFLNNEYWKTTYNFYVVLSHRFVASREPGLPQTQNIQDNLMFSKP